MPEEVGISLAIPPPVIEGALFQSVAVSVSKCRLRVRPKDELKVGICQKAWVPGGFLSIWEQFRGRESSRVVSSFCGETGESDVRPGTRDRSLKPEVRLPVYVTPEPDGLVRECNWRVAARKSHLAGGSVESGFCTTKFWA